jgi:hypothetical protein
VLVPAVDPVGVGPLGPNDPGWLDPELVDAVARRVLELVVERDAGSGSAPSGLLTVAEVAKRLRVSTKWVYAHQRRLGAIKLGEGPKARLRFDAGAVAAELDRDERERGVRQSAALSEPPARVKRSRRRLVSRPLPPVDGAAGRA